MYVSHLSQDRPGPWLTPSQNNHIGTASTLLTVHFLALPCLQILYLGRFQSVLNLAHAASTNALSAASLLTAARFVSTTGHLVIGTPPYWIHLEKNILKQIMAVFLTFCIAFMSINVTSHFATYTPPIHVILIIPFVVERVIVFIIPVTPSLLTTLSFWLGTAPAESKGIAVLSSQEPCPLDDIGFAIVSIDRMPVNVTGHFNDIFLGRHASFGKVVLRRPRLSESNYRDAERVRTEFQVLSSGLMPVPQRFQRETTTWRSLDHPCILPLLGSFKRNEHFYFVCPFAEYGSLLEYLASRPDVHRIRLVSSSLACVRTRP